MAKEKTQQQQLFATSQIAYHWKSVKQLTRGEHVVMMDEELRVTNVRQDGDEWLVTFTHPELGKLEQLYSEHDFVYVKQE